MIDVAAVPRVGDLELEVGVPGFPVDHRVERLNRDLQLREGAGGVDHITGRGVIRAVGAEGRRFQRHEAVVLHRFVVQPLALDRSVMIGGKSGIERLLNRLCHLLSVVGQRDADVVSGIETVRGDHRRLADRLDDSAGAEVDAAPFGEILVDDLDLGNRSFQAVPGDIELALGIGDHIDFGEPGGVNRAFDQLGGFLRRIDQIAEGDVSRLGSVDREFERPVDMRDGIAKNRRSVGITSITGVIVRNPGKTRETRVRDRRRRKTQALNRRAAVFQGEGRPLLQVGGLDRQGQNLNLVGHVAGVDVEVFPNDLAVGIGHLVGGRPGGDDVVGLVDVERHVAADILPLGIDEDVVHRPDRQAEQMPLLKSVDHQLTGFDLFGGLLLFGRTKHFANRAGQFIEHADARL